MQHDSPETLDGTSFVNVPLSTDPRNVASHGIVAASRVPRLLVSVRNVEEAATAIRGGCEILDAKEPSRGSLGMAAPEVLQQISQFVRRHPSQPLLTAALGEIHEYSTDRELRLPPELNFVKLGCARLGNRDWRQRWATVRHACSRILSPDTKWVAVAYADWQLAEAPSPREIITEARQAQCQGVLFDTYLKTNRRLLDWISVNELQELAEQVHSAGLFLALAGSLRTEDLPQLSKIPADIIAIRGAACGGGQRTAAIQESAVRDFHSALQQSWTAARIKGSANDSCPT